MNDSQARDLFDEVEIQDFDVHPAGKTAVCSVNRGKNWELAMLDLHTGRLRYMLSEEQSLRNPTFSPDGRLIAFQKDFEGDENHDVVTVGPDGKRARKITDSVEDNFMPQFSPDGKSIAFLSNRKDDIENLYVIGSRGGKIQRLTDEDLPIKGFAWSPRGDQIACNVGIGDEDYIVTADPTKKRAKRILSKKDVEYSLAGDFGGPFPWSSDGRRLLFLSNENDSVDIGQLDLGTRKTKWLVRSKNEKFVPQWSPDGASLAYMEHMEPAVVVKVKTGSVTRIVSPLEGSSRMMRWMPDGKRVIFVNGSSVRPDEVYVSSGSPRQITQFRKKPVAKTLRIKPEVVRFTTFDRRKIQALFFAPRDKTRRAGVVMPHGGPEMLDSDIWDQLTVMMLDKGFYVIKPNYRGSTGFGREFLHLHDGDLGGGDYLDTVYAGKYLIARGFVDKERLCYWGASYSGFTCMLALTKHPDMWAAGVSIVGFFDWMTEHEAERGYLKKYDESKMGDFSRDSEFLRERSPINFLHSLKAPLLMTASSKDVRCPPTESRAVVKKLKELGNEPEYHEYTDEGHWPRKRKNLIDLYTRSVNFLDKHVPK
ncbi:MAG: S9 family peptidase [Thermoplasmata archaeon]|jgi:dipeptidyl aminopeptidase/acylaminoacyl peptidase|nr:S9 family peptidase [Thermoplasmata archaeon]